MTFQLLATDLHATAVQAKKFFSSEFGVTNFKVETAPFEGSSLKPTYHATLKNKYTLCVEVSELPFSNSIKAFAAECGKESRLIKLFVVVPRAGGPDFPTLFKDAKSYGIGVIELNESGHNQLCGALAFSFFGLRRLDVKEYPAEKRDVLRQALSTFLDGSPEMGCQTLFSTLENLTRKFAIRTEAEGWWRTPVKDEPGRLARDLTKDPWAKVLSDLDHFLEFKPCKARCKDWNHTLVSQARAMTDLRNLTGHVPSTPKKIVERDKKLRTWFEHAGDVLKNWYDVTKPLKLKDI